jgi:hypothetical protein
LSLCLQLSTSLLTDSFGRFFSSFYFTKSQKSRKCKNSRPPNFFPVKILILINKISSYPFKPFALLLFFAETRVISLALPTAASLPINCSLCIKQSLVVLVISNESLLFPIVVVKSHSLLPPTSFGNMVLCHPELSNTSFLSFSFFSCFESFYQIKLCVPRA